METDQPTKGQDEAVKAVKLLLKALLIFLGVMALLTVSIVAFYKIGYNRQYNALEAAIESNEGFRIQDNWRHEDLSLEDFGFMFETPAGRKVQIDIMDGGMVRTPLDEGKGVYLLFHREGKRMGTLISFDDKKFWSGITDVELETISDLLPRMDAFLTQCEGFPMPITDASWDERLNYIWVHAALDGV